MDLCDALLCRRCQERAGDSVDRQRRSLESHLLSLERSYAAITDRQVPGASPLSPPLFLCDFCTKAVTTISMVLYPTFTSQGD